MTLPDQKTKAVLIVEDDEATAELEKRALKKAGLTVHVATQVDEALALLRSESFIAVLLDYNLPGDDPWRVQELAQSLNPRVPVIMVTAMGNELVAAEAIHRGVDDYIKKTDNFWDQLPNIIDRAARLAEAEYEVSRLVSIVEASNDAIMGVSLGGEVVSWNSGAHAMFDYSPEEIIGRSISILTPQDRLAEMGNILEKVHRGERLNHLETVWLKKDGTPIDVSLTISPVQDEEGKVVSTSRIARDITERKQGEKVLLESESRLRNLCDITSKSELGFAEKINLLLQTSCRQLGLENGIFARVEDDRYEVEHAASETNSELEGLSCPLPDTICHEVLLRDQPVAFEHAAASEWRNHPGYLKYKAEAYIGAPVRVAGKVYGSLCFTSSQPRAEKFTPVDIEFLRLNVQWIGSEIERHQAEEALSRSNEILTKFTHMAVGREMRNLELKQQINDLSKQLGRPPPYDVSFAAEAGNPS